ncbi:hypothetical protein IWW55_000969 [Coemansia sp. RSA 2706]|nr:hypothetical protein IWW55_000969 [Coemansia sp. RSA 2706]KAJ2313567.1 hypothetical protein IWW54_001439 [Coemansia sp. RSA 2705]KAJ2322133.1 hypothetical protein IWW52_000284 [Coemansia sp. RSA 2704]KAJ2367203.1 hypothetical protein H4S01_002290 [Coemansia sp. RSA 2610]KAJ2392414.1 hypothetical protein H4S02_000799 [Coemansia sp. RSA 2611]KAJ2738702.1 hypothetical protein H4R23_000968 [Coemansia sp. Cherry 401B]
MRSSQEIIDLTGNSDSEEHPNNSAKKHQKMKAIGDFIRQRAANIGIANHTQFRVEQLAAGAALGNASVILCNKHTQLFNTTFSDRGWACGYRNCQMLLSSLMASEVGVSAFGRIPGDGGVASVSDLQQMLELAWQEGYDVDGAAQLGHRVKGTRKWIGATEVYCILAHLGVRAHIVDFHCPTATDGTHPALFEWIVEYFTSGATADSAGGQKLRFTNKHPLYLQHQGHSRTVVGVELSDVGTSILLFDPDVAVARSENHPAELRSFRLMLNGTRRADQYQILYVDDCVADEADISKFISSTRVP